MLKTNTFYVKVLKTLVAVFVVMLLCRLTAGAMGFLIVLTGMIAAMTRKPWLAAVCYFMGAVIFVANPVVVGMNSLLFLSIRFGGPCIIVALVVSGMIDARGIREKLPIGWMWAYLAIACVSSLDGWMPIVSYFKIAYFATMLIGLIILSRAIQLREQDVRMLRVFFMAVAIFFIIGSFIAYFIPSVGYSMTISKMANWGIFVTGEDISQSTGMVFFNGMTCHSQALSPVVVSLGAWVLGDMLYVERRISPLHVFVLMFVPVLAYMSRSRGAFLEIIAVAGVTWLCALPRANISHSVKSRLRLYMTIGLLLLVGAAVYSQIRSEAMSRWLRKVENVHQDERSLSEAITSSRQGLIDMNMNDFRRNPLLGKGFQVSVWMTLASKSGDFNWFTASVEKGVTPYVILGETGIIGASVFLIFLLVFYGTCFKRRYMSLMTCFTCFLTANLADSTLFSPSFLGGFMWTLSCVGAFSTDILAKRMTMAPPMPMMPPMGGPRRLGWR